MTEKDILERIEALRRDLKRLNDSYCATQGALDDCEHWLAQLQVSQKKQTSPAEEVSGSAAFANT